MRVITGTSDGTAGRMAIAGDGAVTTFSRRSVVELRRLAQGRPRRRVVAEEEEGVPLLGEVGDAAAAGAGDRLVPGRLEVVEGEHVAQVERVDCEQHRAGV